MSRNWISGDVGAGVTLSTDQTNAAGVAGDVTHVASAGSGLYAYLVTGKGEGVGNPAGFASVRLLPTQAVVELTVAGASPVAGDAVYSKVSSGAVVYTKTGAADNYHIGHIVAIPGRVPAAGNSFVYLGSATGAKGA